MDRPASTFELIAERLGSERLRAFADATGIHEDDPAWTSLLITLPLLDAIEDAILRSASCRWSARDQTDDDSVYVPFGPSFEAALADIPY